MATNSARELVNANLSVIPKAVSLRKRKVDKEREKRKECGGSVHASRLASLSQATSLDPSLFPQVAPDLSFRVSSHLGLRQDRQ